MVDLALSDSDSAGVVVLSLGVIASNQLDLVAVGGVARGDLDETILKRELSAVTNTVEVTAGRNVLLVVVETTGGRIDQLKVGRRGLQNRETGG